MINTIELFDKYESIREYLPKNISRNKKAILLKDSKELSKMASCFFLDAFGVLNVGNCVIKKAIHFLKELDKNNIPYLVLSNAASISKFDVCKRFNSMGFNIKSDCVITSREILFHILKDTNKHWGVIAQKQDLELNFSHTFNEEKDFLKSEQFLFLSTRTWDDTCQKELLEKFYKKPFELWIANPDLTSPQSDDTMAKEPGFYSLLEPSIIKNANFIGKPFPQAFEYAINIAKEKWNIKKEDIMMVGDTLHTDILGANSIGLKSALIEGYGFFKGYDALAFIKKSGIYPDVRLKEY